MRSQKKNLKNLWKQLLQDHQYYLALYSQLLSCRGKQKRQNEP
jgi:hypothetical protein